MKKLFTLSVLFLGLLTVSAQQFDCGGGRYYDEIFSGVDVVSDIAYGQNMNINNQMQTLYFDIYKPQGDLVTNRPVIILAHGGSFYGGTKTSPDIVGLCTRFAKMGYVAVSMQYRLESAFNIFFTPESGRPALFLNIAYDAVCDQKALIRFLRKSVVIEGNPYGISPDMVIVGGVSAGSFIGIHNAYLNELSELPSEINLDSDPVEGDSGNPGYSSVPQAVVNLCGAIGDTNWIVNIDKPMVSVHTEDDGTVPYGSDIANPGIPVMLVHGSYSMHERAMNMGTSNPFLSFPTGGHCGFLSSAYEQTLTFVKSFTHSVICLDAIAVENQPDGIFFSAYPNPATDGFNIDIPVLEYDSELQLINMVGQVMHHDKIQAGQTKYFVNAGNFARGMYFIKISSGGKSSTQKIMIR